jgi:hypothetical protein
MLWGQGPHVTWALEAIIGVNWSLKAQKDVYRKEVEVEVSLKPTVSRPVCLGVGLPSGAHDQIFFCLTIAGLLMCGTLSDERMGL